VSSGVRPKEWEQAKSKGASRREERREAQRKGGGNHRQNQREFHRRQKHQGLCREDQLGFDEVNEDENGSEAKGAEKAGRPASEGSGDDEEQRAGLDAEHGGQRGVVGRHENLGVKLELRKKTLCRGVT